MSKIGVHKFSTNVELCYDGPGTTPIEVKVEGYATLHCDNAEDGVYASHIDARVLDRELTAEEIKLINLELTAIESFCDDANNMPFPADGTRIKDHTGSIWKIIASGRNWSTAENYIVIERYTLSLPCISHGPERRIVPMSVFFDEVIQLDKVVPRFEIIEEPCPTGKTSEGSPETAPSQAGS